jgi:ribosomal protein L35AE/L33A
MTDIQTINSAIMNQKWTTDQLNSMVMAIKFARTKMNTQAAWSVKVGDNVKWYSRKHGRTIGGRVLKVNRKRVIVEVSSVRWTVPASLLESA